MGSEMCIRDRHIPSSTVSAGTAASPSASDSPTPMPTSRRLPISSGTHIVSKSSRPGSQTATSMTLPSGEGTSEPLMASPGVESWISSLQAHHVPVSRSPETALEARMTEICSRKRSDWLTRYDRATSSWKMSQGSLWEDDPTCGTFSAAWPRTGYMNADGTLYRLKPPAPAIKEIVFGASPAWPTPTPWEQQESIQSWTDRRERERAKGRNGNGFGTPLDMAARLWATPRMDDSKNNGSASQQERRGSDLNVQVARMLPTPTGDDANNVTRTSGAFQSLSREVDGSLSPDWVSWLMGLPVKWTSLEPLPREEYLDWFHAQQDGTWWQIERGLPRVATGIKDRVNRLKCLGNGIVPASLALFLRGTT